ncbi:hypothetical protein HOP52_01010 [Halomonas campisalis]|uniref:FAD:protein FMN transferase n=1 Tax=Billgrantia campisalis TaxID=74661 RepID=A0ABS9P3J2_9GAMM|nr:FAD:protein FMN transferase [Halomonas campisalis]MCG6656358.1 hypothetical protein [Halomonas campisalis]MDR5861542.1 FAD:protein FMN transferase [Halomonas campisalis]
MIHLAARRFPGLAHRGPALFMLALMLLPMGLLSACRNQLQEHQFQGSVLGTGYHLTLYADLGERQREALEAGIQGELANIQRQGDLLLATLTAAFGPYPGWLARAPEPLLDELVRLLHALAVDRLTERLAEFDIGNAMVEVGGLVRARGAPPGREWRLSLEHVGLPGNGEAPLVRLRDAALVQRPAIRSGGEVLNGHRVLGVSVVASSASEAQQRALWLATGSGGVNVTAAKGLPSRDSAARLVVETPQGIETHNTSALEPWLVH